jgi:hypothetical protein
MKRRRFQYGCLTKRSHRLSEDVWQFRFCETTAEGQRYRRSRTIGTVAQYPTRSDALQAIGEKQGFVTTNVDVETQEPLGRESPGRRQFLRPGR